MKRRGRRRIGTLARIRAASAAIVLTCGAAACGGGSDAPSGAPAPTGATDASTGTAGPDAANGEQLARSKGCAGCHGQDFGGGAGPEWIGLAGSEVTLVDGSTVVADTDYLTRAIANPSADLVADYTLKMPANNLSDAEIADIVAYIETLG